MQLLDDVRLYRFVESCLLDTRTNQDSASPSGKQINFAGAHNMAQIAVGRNHSQHLSLDRMRRNGNPLDVSCPGACAMYARRSSISTSTGSYFQVACCRN